MKDFRYHRRGVSSDKAEVHMAIKDLDKGLYPNNFCKILPDIFGRNEEKCAIIHADTVGTKGILSYLYWNETKNPKIWHWLAQDAMVMNVDDMLCSGCIGPFLISSTIGRNSSQIDGTILAHIIEGNQHFIDFLNQNGLEAYSAGGETADVGDVVRTIDTGITMSSVFERSKVVDIDIKPGDYIVGLASAGQASYETSYNSGISCNGLTSARHDVLCKDYAQLKESYNPSMDDELLYSGSYRLTDSYNSDGQDYLVGDLLCAPTRTFSPVLKDVLKAAGKQINGIIHNTGGAHTKVSKFLKGVQVIKEDLHDIPPVFKMIQEESGTSDKEMFQIFNMGTRMEIYVSYLNIANEIIAISESYNVDAKIIGRTRASISEDSPKVIVKHQSKNLEY